MKTTVELPDALFRKAKTIAAAEGVSLKDLFRQAVEARLDAKRKQAEKPFMRLAGSLKHLHKENLEIDKIIREEFGQIEEEDWR